VTQAREAWATYPSTRGRSGRASLVGDDGGNADTSPSIRTRLLSEHNRPVVLAAAAPILVFSGLIAAAVLIRGQSILGTFFDQLPWVLLTSGMMLIGAGMGVRRGRTRHCRRCTYQMPPSDAPEHCPECGAAWTRPGAFVHGASVRRPGVIIAGAVLLLLAGTQMFGGRTARMFIQPTGVIVGAIITDTGWDHLNWSELQSRTLTAAQDARLADGVLDLLEDEQWLAVDGHAWLQQRMANGEATPAQVARYVRDSMTVTGVRATDALVGRPLALTLELQRPPPMQLSVAGTWAVYVGDIVLVGPEGTRVSSATTPATAAWPAFRLARSVDTARPTGRGDTTTPVRIDVDGPVPSVAGRHRVRVEFWRAIVPRGSNAVPVTRDAEGAVIVPAGVGWAERMVVEQDVEIAPADRP